MRRSPGALRGLASLGICGSVWSAGASAPFSEMDEDLLVGAGEGEIVKLFRGEPVTDLGLPATNFCGPSFECDPVASDGVSDGPERGCGGDPQAEFSGNGARLCDPQRLCLAQASIARWLTAICKLLPDGNPRSYFDVREFPEVGVDDSFRTLADKEFAIALDDEGKEAAFGGGLAFAEIGEVVLEVLFARDA